VKVCRATVAPILSDQPGFVPTFGIGKIPWKVARICADGTHIIARGLTFGAPDQQVRGAGEDPNAVVFERVPGLEDEHLFWQQGAAGG